MALPMPDGTSLARVLRASDADSVCESVKAKRRGAAGTKRGKDLQMMLVSQRLHHAAVSLPTGTHQAAHELAELRALEAVGARRRRRWLNDRLLRELHGPMTVQDMERQFQPVPFGWHEPSALEIVAKPQHQRVWDGFRSIDLDMQQRVLERWEQHVRDASRRRPAAAAAAAAAAASPQGPDDDEQQQQPRHPNGHSGGVEAAALALQRWQGMSRKARAALQKASLHTVVALEQQILEFVEAGQARALCLRGLDSWGRLLVHGLADFFGLSSSSSSSCPAFPAAQQRQQQHQEQHEKQQPEGQHQRPASAVGGSAEASGVEQVLEEEEEAAAAEEEEDGELVVVAAAAGPLSTVREEGGAGEPGEAKEAEEEARRGGDPADDVAAASAVDQDAPAMFVWHPMAKEVAPSPLPSITCSDVLLALRHAGTGSMRARDLHAFMRSHVHGSDAGRSDEWVVL